MFWFMANRFQNRQHKRGWIRNREGETNGWSGKVEDTVESRREEVGGVCVVERHLFGLLCFPDSLTFTGALPGFIPGQQLR